jgi:hypothetical protein
MEPGRPDAKWPLRKSQKFDSGFGARRVRRDRKFYNEDSTSRVVVSQDMADDDWREFEKLTARIEAALAPRGAVVRSPDKVTDLVTGSLREVDASIRLTVGTVPILITVECRRRNSVQDDTWIEQLATKREKVGAARTIAVSTLGFSEPATKTAHLKGIELRKLREITDNEIVGWLRSVVLTNVLLRVKLKKMSAELDFGDSGGTYSFDPEPISGGIRALIRVDDNQFVSPYEVLNLALRSNTMLFPNVPWGGAKVTRVIQAVLPAGMVQVQTADAPRLIKSMGFEVECWYEVKQGSLSDGKYYYYAGADGTIAQRAEFNTDVEGVPLVFGLQVAPGTRTVSVSISARAEVSDSQPKVISRSPESPDKAEA